MKFRSIKLPNLTIKLPEYPSEESKKHFKNLTKELEKEGQKVGLTNRLKERKRELLVITNEKNLIKEINSGLDIRALVALWIENDEFIRKFPVNNKILKKFILLKEKQGLLVVYGLLQLFFKRFDGCGDAEALTNFIKTELSKRTSFFGEDMKKLKKNAKNIISLKGPNNIAYHASKHKMELNDVIKMAGVNQFEKGRYIDVCRQHYYIKIISGLHPGDKHPIFNEIIKKEISEQPFEDRLLGHKIIEIMIQKLLNFKGNIPQNWINIILNIADDPRVSSSSESYRRWWSVIDLKYIEAMYGWLAGADLEFYLKLLENFAKYSNDNSLQRMFPARTRFLRGLHEHKLLKMSKLFLGSEPRKELLSSLNRDEKLRNKKPIFSKINDSNLSVIYLKADNIHIVEGSHNFSMRIYEKLPDNNPFTSYDKQYFDVDDLRKRLEIKYETLYKKNVFKVTHYPNLTWQNKVLIEMRRLGVYVNPEWVLTPEDYREYRRRFSI